MAILKQTPQFQKWMKKLNDKTATAIITDKIFRLAHGESVDTKPVKQGVKELRIHYGPGYRVYFVHSGQELIVLLCGGNKGSQTRDIQKAIQLAKDTPYA